MGKHSYYVRGKAKINFSFHKKKMMLTSPYQKIKMEEAIGGSSVHMSLREGWGKRSVEIASKNAYYAFGETGKTFGKYILDRL